MYLFLSFLSGVALFPLFRFFPISTIIIAVAAAAFLFLTKRPLLLPVIVIGFLYAMFRYSPPTDLSPFSGRMVIMACTAEELSHPLS
ncbi:MAG TPA: hypothetical protein VEI96_01395 [Thermodesulfovibrionales bacterium]|nr:hypothetical protein [Thermodesulfovibrionales bacterium]